MYQVSNYGRVKSLERIVKRNRYGEIKVKEKILKQKKYKKTGYMYVGLRNPKLKLYLVHRLVAETFIPNLENKQTVNHEDGNKENNVVSNLSWATQKEQMEHAIKNNLFKPKENKNKKVYIVEFDKVFNSLSNCNEWLHENGIKTSVSKISAVCRGKRKTHKKLHFKFTDFDNL